MPAAPQPPTAASLPAIALNDAEQALLNQAARLAREQVGPHAAQWERERRIGHEALKQAVEIGLTRLQVPVAWGGLATSYACKAAVADVLASGDFGFAMSLLNTHNVAAKLALDAQPEVARRYVADLIAGRRLGCTALTEPGMGSDFAAIETLASPQPDGSWRITGRKAWITNAAQADVIVLYAQTQAGAGGKGIAGFLIDGRREGFEREPGFALGGQHTIGTGGFRLNHYRVAPDEVLHPPGQAFKAALGSINGARTYIAAMCCGMAADALQVAQTYGRQRQAFGQALADHQGWRWRLAEASAELAACRLMVARAAQAIDAGTDAQLIAAQAKLLATRMAERQIPILAHSLGAEGLREHHPFARHLMGAQVAGFVDGSTEMLLERICATLPV